MRGTETGSFGNLLSRVVHRIRPAPPWVRVAGCVVRSLVFPPPFIVVLCAVGIIALMTWAFALGGEHSFWAVPAYAASAYGMVVLCAALTRIPSPRRLEGALRSAPVVGGAAGRLIDEKGFRSITAARLGLVIDALWAAANVAFGVWGQSLWAVTLGAYYACLALARGLLSRHARAEGAGDRESSLALCRRCGVVTMLLAFPLAGIVALNLSGMGSFYHPVWMTIGVAAYAFLKIGTGVWKFVQYRSGEEPIMLALSNVSLAGGIATILTMGILMLNVFSGEGESELFRFGMTAGMGAAATLGVFALGLALTVRAGRLYKRERLPEEASAL